MIYKSFRYFTSKDVNELETRSYSSLMLSFIKEYGFFINTRTFHRHKKVLNINGSKLLLIMYNFNNRLETIRDENFNLEIYKLLVIS